MLPPLPQDTHQHPKSPPLRLLPSPGPASRRAARPHTRSGLSRSLCVGCARVGSGEKRGSRAEGGRRSPWEDARGGRAKACRREAARFRATCGSAQRKPPRPQKPRPLGHAKPLRPRRRRCGRPSHASSGSPVGGRFVTGNLREPSSGAQIFSAISLGPESPCCAAT